MSKLEFFDVRVADAVRWDSANGVIRGTVVRGLLATNAKEQLIPWYVIRDLDGVEVLCLPMWSCQLSHHDAI